ncbi:hypothetical protein J6590_046077 [Homalodisca vitripennis]|nr:hypothetical protein J6590_046077 [Homalodisca vitripennis]
MPFLLRNNRVDFTTGVTEVFKRPKLELKLDQVAHYIWISSVWLSKISMNQDLQALLIGTAARSRVSLTHYITQNGNISVLVDSTSLTDLLVLQAFNLEHFEIPVSQWVLRHTVRQFPVYGLLSGTFVIMRPPYYARSVFTALPINVLHVPELFPPIIKPRTAVFTIRQLLVLLIEPSLAVWIITEARVTVGSAYWCCGNTNTGESRGVYPGASSAVDRALTGCVDKITEARVTAGSACLLLSHVMCVQQLLVLSIAPSLAVWIITEARVTVGSAYWCCGNNKTAESRGVCPAASSAVDRALPGCVDNYRGSCYRWKCLLLSHVACTLELPVPSTAPSLAVWIITEARVTAGCAYWCCGNNNSAESRGVYPGASSAVDRTLAGCVDNYRGSCYRWMCLLDDYAQPINPFNATISGGRCHSFQTGWTHVNSRFPKDSRNLEDKRMTQRQSRAANRVSLTDARSSSGACDANTALSVAIAERKYNCTERKKHGPDRALSQPLHI